MPKDKPANLTEEITIRTVYYRMGELTASVETLRNQMDSLEKKIDNPKCIKEDRINDIAEVAKSNTAAIGKIDKITNRAIGGKAVLVYLIALLISVAGIVTGTVLTYKTNEKVKQIEKRVNGKEENK